MDKKADKNQKPIKGVLCGVVNCVYHDGSCNCTARQVEIGFSHATNCKDTVCATFKPKDLRIGSEGIG